MYLARYIQELLKYILMNKTIQTFLSLSILLFSMSPNAFALIEEDRSEQIKLKSSEWMELRKKCDELIAARKYAEAEHILKRILGERELLGLDLASERSAIAQLYEKTHQLEKASQEYETLIKEREKQAGEQEDLTVSFALRQYADFLARTGKKDAAQKYSARAKSIDERSQSTKYDTALAAKIAAAPGPAKEKAEKLRKLGEEFLRESDGRKALVYFQKSLELNREDSVALCDRGEANYFNNNEKAAEKDYRKAITLDTKNARAHADLADLLRGRNKFPDAIAEYSKAIELDAKNIDYLGARAKLKDILGKHTEAVADYTKALELRPTSIWARVQRATAYEGLKDFENAAADLAVLIERYPADQDYYEYRGKTYFNAGKYEKSIADYSKVIELAPKYAGGYLGRAKAYEKLEGKNSQKAKSDYANARKFGYQ